MPAQQQHKKHTISEELAHFCESWGMSLFGGVQILFGYAVIIILFEVTGFIKLRMQCQYWPPECYRKPEILLNILNKENHNKGWRWSPYLRMGTDLQLSGMSWWPFETFQKKKKRKRKRLMKKKTGQKGRECWYYLVNAGCRRPTVWLSSSRIPSAWCHLGEKTVTPHRYVCLNWHANGRQPRGKHTQKAGIQST